MDSAAAEPLFSGASSWSTIQADGYARWYQVGSAAAGKTMTVQVPEHGGFAVYDAAGLPVAASWAWGDTSAVLPEGGWLPLGLAALVAAGRLLNEKEGE